MIRKAGAEDIPSIRAMADVAFRHTYKDILSPDQTEYMMELMYSSDSLSRQMKQGHVFFLEDGRGYVSFRPDGHTPDGRPRFHLEKLYVLPSFQKKGLGLELFRTIVREASRAAGGPFRLELNVNRNNPALGFYERLGMRRDAQGDFPIGGGYFMNDYIMAMDYLEHNK